MFCPNCGKQIKEEDNFCRYCGADLRIKEDSNIENFIENSENDSDDVFESLEKDEKKEQSTVVEEGEELVLYEVQKHWMSLFWSIFLTPLFFIYFKVYFMNTHSLFSWVIVIALLVLIIYPIARYKMDIFVITNKFAHIKLGVIQPVEFDIPLKDLNVFDISQTSMGRTMDYGMISFCMDSEKYEYPYIKNPETLQYIVDEPQKFVDESLKES